MIRKLDYITSLIQEGRIKLGMTRVQIKQVLGEPDDISFPTRKYKIPAIWKYGDVEFVFPEARNLTESHNQGLSYIYVDDGKKNVEEPFYVLK